MRIKFQKVINTETILLASIAVMALLLRFSLRSYQSLDFLEFGRDWYWYLRKAGFEAFSKDFYNYSPLYLYLLFLVSLVRPPISAITAVKLPAIIADFILAGYGSQIVKLQYPNGPWRALAFFTFLFAPTAVINGAALGTDGQLIYSCPDCLSLLSANRPPVEWDARIWDCDSI